MNDKTIAPYGSWKSPVTSELIVSDSVSIGDVVLHGDDIYWTEMRPADNARSVIVRRTPDGTMRDLTPSGYSARTRVHESTAAARSASQGPTAGAAPSISATLLTSASTGRQFRRWARLANRSR